MAKKVRSSETITSRWAKKKKKKKVTMGNTGGPNFWSTRNTNNLFIEPAHVS